MPRAKVARIISVIPFFLFALSTWAADDEEQPDEPPAAAKSAGGQGAPAPVRPAPAEAAPPPGAPAPADAALPVRGKRAAKPTPIQQPDEAETPAAPAAAAPAEDIKIQDNAPSRYTVKRGDTLWSISGRFLQNPWKWPDVWGVNKDMVKNPHRIYPGDVIILDLTGSTPRLRLEGVADGGLSRWYGYELQTTNMEPRMRSQSARAAIPMIPAKDIEPFLTRPLIVDADAIARSPRIVATIDNRVALGTDDLAYATGIDRAKGAYWNVYRPGRTFRDPDTGEELGFEAIYVGDGEVTGFGEISTMRITKAIQEVGKEDRLAVMSREQVSNYAPHAPEKQIRAKVVAGSDNSVSEIAPLSVIVLNRGARDGLEVGHVLGVYRSEGVVSLGDRKVALPEQQYGLVMVFRVFNKMSYAFVMNSKRQVNVRDIVKNP